MKSQAAVALALSLHVVLGQPPAQNERARQLEYTRAHYTKFDYRIPMRDGVKLFTTVYAPKDRSQPYPFLIERTPYSVAPYGVDNYRAVLGESESFEKEGFIFVYQDVRGRYLSEGQFIDVPTHKTHPSAPRDTDESTDTYDTIDWLIKNVPGNNGKAGITGISYNGFYAAFALINAHPALKAASPQAPMADVGNGDDAYHNGAFFLAANFGFYSSFKPRGPEPVRPTQHVPFDFGTPDQYDFYLRLGPLSNANALYLKNQSPYWNDLLDHPNYDEFWASRALGPQMQNVTPATLFVGGWFDAEDLSGPLKLYRAVEATGPQSSNTLVMGPWRHGGWAFGDGQKLGNLDFSSKTAEFCRDQIQLPFFVLHLKGPKKGDKFEMPKAWLFQTGTNQWERYDAWPPKSASQRKLYLSAKGGLSFTADSDQGFDEYVSDPAKPVPVIGYAGAGMPGDYMTADQRFAATRPDVLVYQTPPLDNDVTIAGPVSPSLRVATSGTDADFVVKLIDVYPGDYPDPTPNPREVRMGGYQQLVRGEPFRGKFRKSMSKPEPFTPNKPDTIDFTMPDVCHTFRTGHRIMLQIQGSWFPLIDRNPQIFIDIPKAKASDFHKATSRVYRGEKAGSAIALWVDEGPARAAPFSSASANPEP